MSLSPKPRKARVASPKAADAWWYDERGGIHVLIECRDGPVIGCVIQRAKLAAYLKRSAKEPT